MATADNISNSTQPRGYPKNTTLQNIFSSEECTDYLKSLSLITGFHLSVYNENGGRFLTVTENPICKFSETAQAVTADCPGSCEERILEPLKTDQPVISKCRSKVMSFSVPIGYLREKAVIVGRNGFACYEDFLDFLRTSKNKDLQEIPITAPLNFVDENYVASISKYIHNVIIYMLNNLQEKQKISEKLGRFTSLVDTNILERLSKDMNSIYRYIIDTIEFTLGPTSVAMFALDNRTGSYKTVSAAGKYRNAVRDLEFPSKSPVIQQINQTHSPMFRVDLEDEKIIQAGAAGNTRILSLFPVYVSDKMEGLIGVLDNELPQEDTKIISAFREYIEVTIENQALHLSIDKKMDEILASISDLSTSIAPMLNRGQLLRTILEKSTQLLMAEQGSLMLLNSETSELLVEARKSIDNVVQDNIKLRVGEGIAGRVFERGEPMLVKDLENDPRILQKNKPRYRTKSFISIPLRLENRIAGVLNLSDKIGGHAFDENDLKLVQSLTPNAEMAIERSSLYKKIHELEKLSVTDPLTGILNRRYLNSRLSEEIARYRRHRHTFSFLMLDIDGFKQYNDTFGHITGDKVLKNIAKTILSSLRTLDIVARFGGDEFVVILPETSKPDAITIADRLRENIETCPIHTPDGSRGNNLTVSIGLSSFPEDASTEKELLEKTDQALYLAKKGGRNKLVYL